MQHEHINRLIAVLGAPTTLGDDSVTWDLHQLQVEVRALPDGSLAITLPWPLRAIAEPPPFGEVRRRGDAGPETAERAQDAARTASWWTVIGMFIGAGVTMGGAWMCAPKATVIVGD